MHIIDGQQIKPARSLAKLLDITVPHRCNELVGKLLGRNVPDRAAVVSLDVSVTEALKQMCFPNAAVAVEEQWRYLSCRLGVSQSHRGAKRQFIGLADNEVIESSSQRRAAELPTFLVLLRRWRSGHTLAASLCPAGLWSPFDGLWYKQIRSDVDMHL